MADEDLVKMLRLGVDVWNNWSKATLERRADLHGADLHGADLHGADLHGADLHGADLHGADLHGANLSGANLSGANLMAADLSGANLYAVDLTIADLRKARLRRANLQDAKLVGAVFNTVMGMPDTSFNKSRLHGISVSAVGTVDINTLSLSSVDRVDLSGAYLTGADLSGVDLRWANLSRVNLIRTDLHGADLSWADLRGADVSWADLRTANLRDADLSEAYLLGANLFGADLSRARCVKTHLREANLTKCKVYGISAWDIDLIGAVQSDLRITPPEDEAIITVDNLDVAQFLYLLLRNQKIRATLDTITSKIVLILGRFGDRMHILEALREALRHSPNGYIPVLFDFEPQRNRPVLDTVKTIANLARFVIADLTDPHMVRAELTAIIPNLPTVPVQPIIQGEADLPTEYATWALYKSFMPVYRYADLSHLLSSLTEAVIDPVETRVQPHRLGDA